MIGENDNKMEKMVIKRSGRRARVDRRALTCEMYFLHFSSQLDFHRGPGNEQTRYPRVRAKLREATPTAKGGVGLGDHPRSSREKSFFNIFSMQNLYATFCNIL